MPSVERVHTLKNQAQEHEKQTRFQNKHQFEQNAPLYDILSKAAIDLSKTDLQSTLSDKYDQIQATWYIGNLASSSSKLSIRMEDTETWMVLNKIALHKIIETYEATMNGSETEHQILNDKSLNKLMCILEDFVKAGYTSYRKHIVNLALETLNKRSSETHRSAHEKARKIAQNNPIHFLGKLNNNSSLSL